MEINNFWIVTKPSNVSTFGDICFRSNIRDLQKQFLGGLLAEDIHGVYTHKGEAITEASHLLGARNRKLEMEKILNKES